jgi:hypothetical protein
MSAMVKTGHFKNHFNMVITVETSVQDFVEFSEVSSDGEIIKE